MGGSNISCSPFWRKFTYIPATLLHIFSHKCKSADTLNFFFQNFHNSTFFAAGTFFSTLSHTYKRQYKNFCPRIPRKYPGSGYFLVSSTMIPLKSLKYKIPNAVWNRMSQIYSFIHVTSRGHRSYQILGAKSAIYLVKFCLIFKINFSHERIWISLKIECTVVHSVHPASLSLFHVCFIKKQLRNLENFHSSVLLW